MEGSAVEQGECYDRMESQRTEIKTFCNEVFSKINELKDAIHAKEVETVKERGEAAVESMKEKVEQTRREWILEHWRDIALVVILASVGAGRVADYGPTILRILGGG